MAARESKSIKQLKKQVKRFNARIDDMERNIKALQDAAGGVVTTQLTAALEEESAQDAGPRSNFSQEDVENADEMTEVAEEIADIKEKKKKGKKRKKK